MTGLSLRRAWGVSLLVHGGLAVMLAGTAVDDPGAEGDDSGWSGGRTYFLSGLEAPGAQAAGPAPLPQTEPAPTVPPAEPDPEPEPEPDLPADTLEPETAEVPADPPEDSVPDAAAPAGAGQIPAGEGRAEGSETGEAAGEDAAGSGEAAGTGTPYRPPRLLVAALPLSPDRVSDLPQDGEIEVRVLVGVDGRVRAVEPVRGPVAPELMAAIRDAAGVMRFVPARRHGSPVEAWSPITFVFEE